MAQAQHDIAPRRAEAEDIQARRGFYRRFLTISTVFSAHVIVIVAIVLALIAPGHHGT